MYLYTVAILCLRFFNLAIEQQAAQPLKYIKSTNKQTNTVLVCHVIERLCSAIFTCMYKYRVVCM